MTATPTGELVTTTGEPATSARPEPSHVPRRVPLVQVAANEEGEFSSGFGQQNEPFLPYIGEFRRTLAGYASDPAHRQRVASGGVATSLLRFALEQKIVDGVVVSRADFASGQLGYKVQIVTNARELESFGTSAYFNIPVDRHSREMDEFPGSLAVCALPCHTSILRKRQANGKNLQNVKLFFSLFCGHNNEKELISFVFQKEKIDESQVTDMVVDRSYLGGGINVTLRDGSTRVIHFRHFNVYRSLWFFSKQMCRYCDDHLGAAADVSIGDIFIKTFRQKDIKHSAVVTRTEAGDALVQQAMQAGVLTLEPIPAESVYRAQKRVLLPSHDLKSRHHAARLTGFASKKPSLGAFRFRSFLTYSLFNLNDRISRTRWGPRLLRVIPRPLLYAYIGSIKLINHSLKPLSKEKLHG